MIAYTAVHLQDTTQEATPLPGGLPNFAYQASVCHTWNRSQPWLRKSKPQGDQQGREAQ